MKFRLKPDYKESRESINVRVPKGRKLYRSKNRSLALELGHKYF
jgi:hypothetical protein